MHAQTEAGVLRAVRDGKAAVGVLPITSDTHTRRASAEPWWYTLTAGGSERPRIVATLPWLTRSETGSDDLIVVDLVSGALLDRVATGSRIANGMFLTQSGDRDVFYCSTLGMARVAWG